MEKEPSGLNESLPGSDNPVIPSAEQPCTGHVSGGPAPGVETRSAASGSVSGKTGAVSGRKGVLRRVSLARAFKERSRLALRISDSIERIKEENSIPEGVPRSIDIREEFDHYMSLCEKMIALRQTISRANAGIAGSLVELAEVKNILAQIRRIPTAEGQQSSFSKTDVKIAEIRKAELSGMMDSLRERAHALQDEIDEFNARTQIEFEF